MTCGHDALDYDVLPVGGLVLTDRSRAIIRSWFLAERLAGGPRKRVRRMSQIDVTSVVDFHFVVPDTTGEMYNAHTHGLEAFGHMEVQVLTPGYCRSSAWSILSSHADAVINRGEVFKAGDTCEIDGVTCAYVELSGDFPGDPTRLRIVDVLPAVKGSPRAHLHYN